MLTIFARKKGSKDKRKRKRKSKTKSAPSLRDIQKQKELEETIRKRKLQERRENRKSAESKFGVVKNISKESRGWINLLRGFYGK